MKKAFLVIILSLFIVLSLFASSQKYIEIDSREWRAVSWLCRYVGIPGPSSFGPVTIAQLDNAINRAASIIGNDNELVVSTRKLIHSEEYTVDDGIGYFNIDLFINPEVYIQSNPDSSETFDDGYVAFVDRDWEIRKMKDRDPLFGFELEFGIHDYAYGIFRMGKGIDYLRNDIFDQGFFYNFSFSSSSEEEPRRAGVSVGTDNLSLIIGRAGVSLGEGFTGSTILGDNLNFQEFLKAGFFSDSMGIFLNLTHFDSSHGKVRDTESPFGLISSRFSGYHQIRFTPLWEISLFGKMKVGISFPNMIDTDSPFDIRLLNPFAFLHQYYNMKEYKILEGNNMMALNISFSPIEKWNIYLEGCLDQFQGKDEIEGHTDDVDPNGWATLMNISYSDIILSGRTTIFLEGVYTSPAMYLNAKYYNADGSITNTKTSKYAWSQDWLVGYYSNTENLVNDIAWSGYIYGPDSIVGAIGFYYDNLRNIELNSRIQYMAHGEKGRGSAFINYTFEDMRTAETINAMSPTGIVEHTLSLSSELKLHFLSSLDLYLGASFSYKWNYRNQEGVNRSNLQIALGSKYSFTL